MESKIINGKLIAKKMRESIKIEIDKCKKKPGLAMILVGNDSASKIYVNLKEKECEKLGIISKKIILDPNITKKELLNTINNLNEDSNIHGILVQLPLPDHIDETNVIKSINPLKDVDGFHPINAGYLFQGIPKILPCTSRGIIKIIDSVGYNLKGKHAVVVGRSKIVGNPTSQILLQKGATVTICHLDTKNLAFHTKQADILIVAAGEPNLITKEMVKPDVFVIDVGINKIENCSKEFIQNNENNKKSTICGDVDFENVKNKASYITPVPGGVGPMTVIMLMLNTLDAYKTLN